VRELLHFLIFVDMACVAVLVAMGVRLEFLKAGELPERRSFLSLRRPIPNELSNEYRAYQRRFVRILFAFVILIAMGALLLWIDNSHFSAAR
jgi:hypothetical protein